MVLFLRAPQLSSLVGSLGGSSCLNSILHAFLGLTSSRLHSAIFLSASPFFLWLPCLLNPSPLFLLAVNLGFSPFLHSQHSLPFFFFLHLLLPVAVFLVLPLICDLWIYPFLLSLSGHLNPSERVSHCGWEGSCLGERYHFPESSYRFFNSSTSSSFYTC